MKLEQQEKIIHEALGEVSALFMSQGDTPAGQIIMPTEELSRIAGETIKRLKTDVIEILKRRIEHADEMVKPMFGEKHANVEKNLLWSIWDEIEPRPTGQV